MKNIFAKLKPKTKVHDTWYGNGIVLSKSKRRCLIKLNALYGKRFVECKYDSAHVNAFIRKGHKK